MRSAAPRTVLRRVASSSPAAATLSCGTVEIRAFDQQTRLEDTVALAALSVCLVHRYASNFDAEEPLVEVPTELIDDNKVRASLSGLEGNLIDLPRSRQAAATDLAQETIEELRPDARQLGCEEELEGLRRLIEGGTGASRQLQTLEREGGTEGLIRRLCAETEA